MDELTLYLQEALDSGAVTRAEILQPDGSVRASVGRALTTLPEGRRLAALFEAPSDALSTGITVGGVTYVSAEADRRLLHGKHGSTGVVAVKSPSCIVVGLYGEGRPPADAVLTVGNLADLIAARSPQRSAPDPAPDTATEHPSAP